MLALSIHDFFEGIALGVETSTTATYFLLAAFASHKVVISGTVGLNWARSQVIVISLLSCLISQNYLAQPPCGCSLHDCLLWDISCWNRSGSGS